VWILYNDTSNPGGSHQHGCWKKLSKADQDIIQKAQRRILIGGERGEGRRRVRQKLRRFSVADRMLTDAQLKEVARQVRKKVWPQMEQLVGKELMDRVYKESGIPRQ
jgi:TRAP-type C4-dicarboxylate transport system substrate-binding protein